MANLNKVILIGRLTRDPEAVPFNNGGKVVKLGFATTGQRKKNAQTGQWEDEPMFIDVKIFNRGENGRSADIAEESLRKGSLIAVEGRLVLEKWNDKTTGQERSKHVVLCDHFEFLEPKGSQPGGTAGGGGRSQQFNGGDDEYAPAPPPARQSAPPARTSPAPQPQRSSRPQPTYNNDANQGGDDDIPF